MQRGDTEDARSHLEDISNHDPLREVNTDMLYTE